jgi:hypothetical protein
MREGVSEAVEVDFTQSGTLGPTFYHLGQSVPVLLHRPEVAEPQGRGIGVLVAGPGPDVVVETLSSLSPERAGPFTAPLALGHYDVNIPVYVRNIQAC